MRGCNADFSDVSDIIITITMTRK